MKEGIKKTAEKIVPYVGTFVVCGTVGVAEEVIRKVVSPYLEKAKEVITKTAEKAIK